ncbi:uncharacterized protein LOC113973833 isoform X2 [Neopelma chrysocephalum]|uniref:uncharacterized protein LOC113973833 isoform X2 n=1 Tax=Neopelma chrysocephalum TaxID=114329 RepID=UPI000FCD07C4|nr:uncharacterized protein LOC113973833 isoform X2 [Neopelma chrysocephalum]
MARAGSDARKCLQAAPRWQQRHHQLRAWAGLTCRHTETAPCPHGLAQNLDLPCRAPSADFGESVCILPLVLVRICSFVMKPSLFQNAVFCLYLHHRKRRKAGVWIRLLCGPWGKISGEDMVSMMTTLWQVIIPMIVLSHFSASLPSRESPPRIERHADGLFHSELSKMNGNAYVRQLVKHLVGLKERSQRHSDGLFTSEYSKMRGNAQVQKFIQNLMGRKRSSPGPVNTDVQEREGENSPAELCFLRLYQSFLNTSLSDRDAQEAAAITSRYFCPISKPLVADMKEDTDGSA